MQFYKNRPVYIPIMKYSQCFIILICLFLAFSQKAILFSSSIGFYNYRQTSSVLRVYHKLKDYGFKDNDILLTIPQNIGCCQKNPRFGQVSFIDNDYTNFNFDLEIDYSYSDINLQRIFNLIRMRFDKQDIGKRGFTLPNHPEPLFIYLTGHGGNTYFKIRQRQAIISQNFRDLFIDLSFQKRFSKILLISDSCSAITPFQTVDIQNFTAFASSSIDQKSSSHGFDKQLNSPKSDDFTFYLIQFLQKNHPRQKNIYLKDIFEYMSFQKLKVHSKIVGNGKQSLKTINEFIIKRQNKIINKLFKLQHLI